MVVLLDLARSCKSMRRHVESSQSKRCPGSPPLGLKPAAWPPAADEGLGGHMSHGCPPGALSLHPLGSWDAVIRPPDPARQSPRAGGWMDGAGTDHRPAWNLRQLGLGQEADGWQLGGHPGFTAPRVTCHPPHPGPLWAAGGRSRGHPLAGFPSWPHTA